MDSEANRLQYADVLKGIAVVTIVFYHLVAPSVGKTVLNHLMEILLTAFFVFSGFFYRPGEKTLKKRIAGRAKNILVPFFRYSLLFWLAGSVYLVGAEGVPFSETLLCLRNYLGGCIWNRVIQGWFGWEYYSLGKRYFFLAGFWFLIALLLASILFFAIADRVLQSRAKTLAAAAVLFAVTGGCRQFGVDLPYNMQLVPYWTAFMLLGAFAGQENLFEHPALTKKTKWAAGAASLAAGIAVAFLKTPSLNLFRGSFGENELCSMLLCIGAAVPAIWGLGQLIALAEQAGGRMKELAWLGSHSLIIYLYHMFFAWIICTVTGSSLFYTDPVSGSTVAKSVMLALSCLLLCILLIIAGEKQKAFLPLLRRRELS